MSSELSTKKDPKISYTAYKLYIKDIKEGQILKTHEDRSYFTTKFHLNAFKVRLLGTIFNLLTYDPDEAAGRKEAAYIILDDGTEQIRLKTWEPTLLEKIKKLKIGQIIDVIGSVREYNNEIYISPNIIIPVIDINVELLRDLDIIEFRKSFKSIKAPRDLDSKVTPEQIQTPKQVEDQVQADGEDLDDDASKVIMDLIQELDEGEGVEIHQIKERCQLSDEILKKHIQYLYENGFIYEPSLQRYKIL